MAGSQHLRPEDRPDFEETLRLALTGLTRRRPGLREQALADADLILSAEAVAEAYTAYVALRRSTAVREPAAQHTALAALAVLTPMISAASATVLLLIGYILQLADSEAELPAALITAGWVLAAICGISTVLALAALFRTAVRERGGPPSAAKVERARLEWKRALLERGVTPYLVERATGKGPTPGGGSDDNSGRTQLG